MKQCCICGTKFNDKTKQETLCYGCAKCHKGDVKNQVLTQYLKLFGKEAESGSKTPLKSPQ